MGIKVVLADQQDKLVIMINKSDRWWYRLLQVAYSGSLVLIAIAILIFAYSSKPTFEPILSTYDVVCNDGRMLGKALGVQLDGYYTDLDTTKEQEWSRLMCAKPALTAENYQDVFSYYQCYSGVTKNGFTPIICPDTDFTIASQIPDTQNYTLHIREKNYSGSWTEVGTIIVVGFVLLFIFALVIRALFLYVAFKESFLKNMGYKSLRKGDYRKS